MMLHVTDLISMSRANPEDSEQGSCYDVACNRPDFNEQGEPGGFGTRELL